MDRKSLNYFPASETSESEYWDLLNKAPSYELKKVKKKIKTVKVPYYMGHTYFI